MKISLEDLREAAAVVGEAGGPEAAIVAQFAVDLAVTAQFNANWRSDCTAGSAQALAPSRPTPCAHLSAGR